MKDIITAKIVAVATAIMRVPAGAGSIVARAMAASADVEDRPIGIIGAAALTIVAAGVVVDRASSGASRRRTKGSPSWRNT